MFQNIFTQLRRFLPILFDTIPFIVEHKLWRGFFKEKAILIISATIAVIIPWSIYSYLSSEDGIQHQQGVSEKLTNVIGTKDLWEAVSGGTESYLIIIMISMLITFFGNRTMEELTGHKVKLTFNNYLSSQFRVFVLSIRNFVLEKFISIPIVFLVSLFFPDFVGKIVAFSISGFFAGYIFFDAYFETFKIKIRNAVPLINSHFAASSIIGMVAITLFNIPLLGGIIASFICTVAATRYLHYGQNWEK